MSQNVIAAMDGTGKEYVPFTPLAPYETPSAVDAICEKLSAKEIVRRAIYSKVGKLTKSDITELCPSIGIKSVELALKQLVEEGVLLKRGSGRATFYVRSDSEIN